MINNSNILDWRQRTGPIGVRMTNDYLFRVLLQENTDVLKALIGSLMHMRFEDIISVTIKNPIEPGKTIDEKSYILDVRVVLNDSENIDLEMQVLNENNWPDRSLAYLCRSYDDINKGSSYEKVKPAVQFDFLDFTLFEDSPEFFASYYLQNEKNNRRYTGKFRLSVVDLSRIDLATDEDKYYGIDRWARLFKAKTWEELKMLAQEDRYIDSAVDTVSYVTSDEHMKMIMDAREEYYARERYRKKKQEEYEAAKAEYEANKELYAKTALEAEKIKAEFEEAVNELSEVKAKAAESEAKAAESEAKAAESEAKAAESEAKAAESAAKLSESEQKLCEAFNENEKLKAELELLKKRLGDQ